MTDLVTRLRQLEVSICQEAADEIERLHDKLDNTINQIDLAERAIERAMNEAN